MPNVNDWQFKNSHSFILRSVVHDDDLVAGTQKVADRHLNDGSLVARRTMTITRLCCGIL